MYFVFTKHYKEAAKDEKSLMFSKNELPLKVRLHMYYYYIISISLVRVMQGA